MGLRGLFSEIAEAIRMREGSAESIAALDFPERILALPSGSGIVLQELRIVSPPVKTQYYYNCFGGEEFDPEGMAMEAEVGDGSRSFSFPVDAADVGFAPSGALAAGTTEVAVLFGLGGGAVSAAQAVTVLHRAPSWAELEDACDDWAALMAFAGSWVELEEL